MSSRRAAASSRGPGLPRNATPDYRALLDVALEEARQGQAEGGVPIGAALFDATGALLGRGHNRRVQCDDPSAHAETDAFRRAGRRRGYRDTILATTLAPCWYCAGLVAQFGIGTVVVGESRTFRGGIDWLRARGVNVVDVDSPECAHLLGAFVKTHPELWREDIGESAGPVEAPAEPDRRAGAGDAVSPAPLRVPAGSAERRS